MFPKYPQIERSEVKQLSESGGKDDAAVSSSLREKARPSRSPGVAPPAVEARRRRSGSVPSDGASLKAGGNDERAWGLPGAKKLRANLGGAGQNGLLRRFGEAGEATEAPREAPREGLSAAS
ncbi:hypothetical protein TGPRC2_425550 [Toxoplasma gondii TgCatPRC2]|uniref:Uncharacterized protein n=1 Tax=Toxoplasma gondii TgCatPRC2 TaxID=1130821 RepID=A0A151HAF5_TOXGO|nr:hypothetical protein TGPRC2_425550 [Toxoplasma gondii TgCatPRC2]